MANPKPRRCAIYTRKSSEEGLEQDFNSLDAQRDACEAFIRSQVGEGWRPVKTAYDDGGFSGGTMERPALRRLLSDIEQNLIDVVVVYKVDRLTRALSDFAKMVDLFDAHGVSFVAVTQQFNTTSSMGRLTLNVLLSFAQFEREVTGERIRDKIAASKRKGMWVGGVPPLGYDVRDRKLKVNVAEAKIVRQLFERYLELGSVRLLRHDLDRRGIRSKLRVSSDGKRSGGAVFSRGALYTLLSNPVYVGEIRHKRERHPGQHQAIVDRGLWESVQRMLRDHTVRRTRRSAAEPSPLMGKLFDEDGASLTPSHAVKGERRYRYYVSRSLIRGNGGQEKGGWRLPALEIERAVTKAAAKLVTDRAAVVLAAQEAGVAAHQLECVLRDAQKWTASLESSAESGSALSSLVDRVQLKREEIQVALKLQVQAPEGGELSIPLSRSFPVKIRRRGVELRLVVPGESSRRADQSLLRVIARGHSWFGELRSARAASIPAIAAREKLSESYVRRLVRLAFLAPRIVEAIVAGRHPVQLTADRLVLRKDLPFDWRRQEKVLGFEF